MGRKLLLGLLVLAAVGWFWPRPERQFKNLSVAEFDRGLARDPFVVDVHTPEQEHLAGTDTFIPYDQIGSRLAELPADKNAEIVLYCRSGSMSAQAAQVLVDNGYTNVSHLVGGIQAWREQHQGIFMTPAGQDLGTVIYGDAVSADFTLQNNTNQEITLTKVSTSCSCTKALPEKTMIKPWETTVIKVTFDPAVHKDDTDLGEITRTIFIDTDHVNFPRAEAKITAAVVKNEPL